MLQPLADVCHRADGAAQTQQIAPQPVQVVEFPLGQRLSQDFFLEVVDLGLDASITGR